MVSVMPLRDFAQLDGPDFLAGLGIHRDGVIVQRVVENLAVVIDLAAIDDIAAGHALRRRIDARANISISDRRSSHPARTIRWDRRRRHTSCRRRRWARLPGRGWSRPKMSRPRCSLPALAALIWFRPRKAGLRVILGRHHPLLVVACISDCRSSAKRGASQHANSAATAAKDSSGYLSRCHVHEITESSVEECCGLRRISSGRTARWRWRRRPDWPAPTSAARRSAGPAAASGPSERHSRPAWCRSRCGANSMITPGRSVATAAVITNSARAP